MLRIFFSFVCYYQLHFNTCCINYILSSLCGGVFLTKYSLNGTVSCCKLQCVMLDFHHNLQITDRTILDKQVVHETLYKLWKDEYIDSEVCCINRTHSISSLDKLSTSSFLRFCHFTLESLHQNIFHGRLTVYLLQCLMSLTNFNDVKEVNWFSMSFNSASLDSVKTFS